MCQVTDDVLAYEVRDDGGSLKVIHCNQLFLVATSWSCAMSQGESESLSEEGTTHSALMELTPLEWESEAPEDQVDEAVILCLGSQVLLGWVDGIL